MLIIQDYDDQEELNGLKATYCESLFERINNNIRCNNLYLSNFYNQLYAKYPKKLQYTEFISECMYYTFLAVMDFEILDGGNWNGIIDGTDKINIGRLLTYIKNTVQKKVYQYVVNEDKLFTRGEIEGEKGQHVMVKLNLISLDTLVTGADGEEITLERLVSNEQNLGFRFNYNWNYYMLWFNENKARILTKNQLKYLESGLVCSRKNKRIRERVLRFWEQENPMGKKTLREIHKEKELKLWGSLLSLVYDDSIECNKLNQHISNWIIENLDDQLVSNLVYDTVTGLECKNVVLAYHKQATTIPNKVLYKLVWEIENRVQKMNESVIEGVRFYKRKDEIGRWTLEEHKKYERYLKQFKNQQCYVFHNGNFRKIQMFKDKKTLNILEVTPTGIELLTKIN